MNRKHFPVFSSLPVVAAAFLFSLLLGGVVAAAGQTAPGMTEVSGTYTNAEAGVQITFPDGWSGAEIPAGGQILVLTAPGGISSAEVTKSITLTTAVKTGRNPNDPGSFNNDLQTCSDPSVKSRAVAGVQGMELVVQCPGTGQTFKMVVVGTADRWIVVTYMSPSAEFDSDVGKFDAAVNSLTVTGAVDAEGRTNLGLELKSVIQSVLVKGQNVDLALNTTSTISNFKLEEENKKISFTAEGESGTQGTTVIPVGKVLEGPFIVTIDGQSTTNFEVTNEGTSEATIKISYTHSSHEITVTGTSVVPEFPFGAVGAIAAVIGITSILVRTKFWNTKI